MSASLELRSIHLRVADLERSVRFYAGQLGLHLVERDERTAALATSAEAPPLLFLVEDQLARPPPSDAAGLFHAALLLPTRAALGSWLRTTADAGVKFDGFSDHGVSEAIYLSDPDRNGLEFYADRPRDAWLFHNGKLQMITEPLALPELLAAGTSHIGAPLVGAKWGHLHLRVTSLDESQAFFASTLGVELMQEFGDSARFLAADGYHHHVGINRWGGVRQHQPAGSLGLVEAIFARPGTNREVSFRDPDGIAVRVTPDKGA
jgi:catechol 2,3-dioxygenase